MLTESPRGASEEEKQMIYFKYCTIDEKGGESMNKSSARPGKGKLRTLTVLGILVLVTAWICLFVGSSHMTVRECLDAGMNGHVAKPFDPEKLVELLASCI